MKVPRPRIARVIANQTLSKGHSKRFSQEVAAYLLIERRVNELDSILRDIQADWAQSGYVEVLAGRAHPLTPGAKTEIARQGKKLYPDAKQVSVTETENPEMIGGVRLNTADQQLDLSIRAKLNKFKQLATEGKK